MKHHRTTATEGPSVITAAVRRGNVTQLEQVHVDTRTFRDVAARACPQEQPPLPVSEIRQKLNSLWDETSGLEKVVDYLIEKINPITRPFPRMDDKNEADPKKAAQAEISNDLECVAERLAHLAKRVGETIDALAI